MSDRSTVNNCERCGHSMGKYSICCLNPDCGHIHMRPPKSTAPLLCCPECGTSTDYGHAISCSQVGSVSILELTTADHDFSCPECGVGAGHMHLDYCNRGYSSEGTIGSTTPCPLCGQPMDTAHVCMQAPKPDPIIYPSIGSGWLGWTCPR